MKKNIINYTLAALAALTVSNSAMAQNAKHGDKSKLKTEKGRAFEDPQENTGVVGGAIIGAWPVIPVAAGQTVSVNTYVTDPKFKKEDFPIKVELYNSFEDFLKDAKGRINYYKSNPRVDRDAAELGQIEKRPAYHAKISDSKIRSELLKDLSDLVIDEKESYTLASIAKEMGYKNVFIPIMTYHEGKKDVKGESIPMIIDIAYLVQAPSEIRYVTAPDTTKKPLPVKKEKVVLPDTTKKEEKKQKNIQVYFGKGIEDNPVFGQIDQTRAGINFGIVYLGVISGQGKGSVEKLVKTYNNGTDNGYTTDSITKMHSGLKQEGLEIGVAVTKNIKLNLAAVYNSKSINTIDTITQHVNDGVRYRTIKYLGDPTYEKWGYVSLIPTLEAKTGHLKIIKHFGVSLGGYIGAGIPFKNEHIGKISPIYGLSVHVGFGE